MQLYTLVFKILTNYEKQNRYTEILKQIQNTIHIIRCL